MLATYYQAARHNRRRTYVLPQFYLLFYSPATLWARWTELYQNWSHVRNCDLKMHVRNLEYSHPLRIEDPKTTFFRRLRNLRPTLMAYIFRMKHGIHNQTSVLETTRGLLHRVKMSWNVVPKGIKNGPALLPTLRKFSILLHCQALHTEISEWNSTKLPNGGQ